MSPRREGETQEQYRYRLELTQENHEEEIKNLWNEVSSVRSVAVEAREMAMQTNAMIELMPQRVIEEMKKQKDRGLNWVVGIASIVGTIAAIVIAVVK